MSADEYLNKDQFNVIHKGPHPFGGEYSMVTDSTGNDIGQMRYRPENWPEHGDFTSVEHISVDEEHRGKGAAKALYEKVGEHTGTPFLHHRDEMSPEAKGAVRSAARVGAGDHRIMTWRKGTRVVQRYPR